MNRHSGWETDPGPPPGHREPPRQKPEAELSSPTAAASEKTGKKKRMPEWKRFLIKLAVFALALFLVFSYVLGVRIYHDNRMHPFLKDGDLLITYKLDDYHTGDVVVYRNPRTGEADVSRIVAIGEKEIEITDLGALLIDGCAPSEQVYYQTKPLEGSEICFPYRMTREGYFLLDDYREIGLDSRIFGELTEDDLLGKVVYLLRRRGI